MWTIIVKIVVVGQEDVVVAMLWKVRQSGRKDVHSRDSTLTLARRWMVCERCKRLKMTKCRRTLNIPMHGRSGEH